MLVIYQFSSLNFVDDNTGAVKHWCLDLGHLSPSFKSDMYLCVPLFHGHINFPLSFIFFFLPFFKDFFEYIELTWIIQANLSSLKPMD